MFDCYKIENCFKPNTSDKQPHCYWCPSSGCISSSAFKSVKLTIQHCKFLKWQSVEGITNKRPSETKARTSSEHHADNLHKRLLRPQNCKYHHFCHIEEDWEFSNNLAEIKFTVQEPIIHSAGWQRSITFWILSLLGTQNMSSSDRLVWT